MVGVRLQKEETYGSFRQNTVAQYIATRPIMDLFLTENKRPGPRVPMHVWKQEGLYLEEMRTEAWEVERMKGGGDTEGT